MSISWWDFMPLISAVCSLQLQNSWRRGGMLAILKWQIHLQIVFSHWFRSRRSWDNFQTVWACIYRGMQHAGRREEKREERRMKNRGRAVRTTKIFKSRIGRIVWETQVFRRRTEKEINKERDTEHEREMKVWLRRSEGMQRVRANKQSSEQGELPWESSRECS